jgi:hypothetical protein
MAIRAKAIALLALGKVAASRLLPTLTVLLSVVCQRKTSFGLTVLDLAALASWKSGATTHWGASWIKPQPLRLRAHHISESTIYTGLALQAFWQRVS